ncbi:UbiA-like polyprenyltransferase [Nitrospirota bacterium]
MFKKVVLYLKMIKFSHSVFALPFAFTSALMAADGIPGLRQVFWITLAMVSARSGAMGLNRVIDSKIDALNPRTMEREVPSGKISAGSAMVFSLVSLGVLVLSAWMLNPLCLKLSPMAIAVLVLYSYSKRFTWGAHFVLGVAISAAPIGAWIAVRGSFDPSVLALAAAVVLWLAGFDILYALQDTNFDRKHGLKSIPARFGIKRAFMIARLLHLSSWGFLLLTGMIFSMGLAYWAGMVLVALLFLYEHSLIRHDDLSRLDMAFFNMNGYISMTVFAFTLADYLAF